MTATTLTALDADAFVQAWKANRDDIRSWLYARAPWAADEVVSEAFCRAWAARHTFDPHRAPVRAWLFGLARNALIDHLRYERRRPVVHFDEIAGSLFQGADAADAVADRTDVAAEVVDRLSVVALLAGLPERYRTVLAYRYLLDMDVPATAAVLGCATGTVKSLTHRATYKARELIGGAP